MGKIEPESEEDTEYILPDQKIKIKSHNVTDKPEENMQEKPHRKYRVTSFSKIKIVFSKDEVSISIYLIVCILCAQ